MRSSIDLPRATLVVAILFALASFACASDPEPTAEEKLGPMAGELSGAPDWVTKGCGAFWGDDSPSKLCGVGSAGGSRNHSLMVTAAQGRGRTAIARSLDLHVKAMLKDYPFSDVLRLIEAN